MIIAVYFAGYSEVDNFETLIPYSTTFAGGSQDAFLSILDFDADCDGLADLTEDIIGTSSDLVDTDGDNFLDSYELIYGSDPLDDTSYPSMPQDWYDAIYEDLDGNTTLIQNLITWVDGNSTLLENVIQQLNENSTLLTQVISWLDGNHTTIETLFTYVEANATLLLSSIEDVNGNTAELDVLATLISGNIAALNSINASTLRTLMNLGKS
ncbi:MAG: hypothetical protein GF411_20065 [Candidatus Lokiarchaeota archaeon]|nr:hypothetical protein [Candidatus Lokiarchaeota archaeon]